jgi:hypothetical protein
VPIIFGIDGNFIFSQVRSTALALVSSC